MIVNYMPDEGENHQVKSIFDPKEFSFPITSPPSEVVSALCNDCQKSFTFSLRHHYCRMCGQQFCVDCLMFKQIPHLRFHRQIRSSLSEMFWWKTTFHLSTSFHRCQTSDWMQSMSMFRYFSLYSINIERKVMNHSIDKCDEERWTSDYQTISWEKSASNSIRLSWFNHVRYVVMQRFILWVQSWLVSTCMKQWIILGVNQQNCMLIVRLFSIYPWKSSSMFDIICRSTLKCISINYCLQLSYAQVNYSPR